MEIGLRNKQDLVVDKSHSAAHMGSGTLEVFATPSMIALMENTCMHCVAPYLEADASTVGTLINVKHLSATPVGDTVTCSCELLEIDRKRLVFSVQASDSVGLIGEGIHERFVVNIDRFMQKTLEKLK